MSRTNNQNYSPRPSESVEVVVIGRDVHYPSRASSDISWSTSPFFRVSSTANFRSATSLEYADIFEVDESGFVLEGAVENEEKKNTLAQLLSTLRLKLRALGKRIGLVNCGQA